MSIRLHCIITSLSPQGAQKFMLRLLEQIDRQRFSPSVTCLSGHAHMVDRFRELDIPVQVLGLRGNVRGLTALTRLVRILRAERPHIVQTWLYHSDLVGGLVAKALGRTPVVWNLRHSNLDPGLNKQTTLLVTRICARLSHHLPDKIICCAEEARRVHAGIGYDDEKMLVIPNGFDLTCFKPDPDARVAVREELAIPEKDLVVGLVARHDKLKDHGNFISAARIFSDRYQNTSYVLCGDGVDWSNEALVTPIRQAGLEKSFRLLGRRADVARITAALDVAASSSCGEGFSNTVGEALACEVPCVVTDVGDSALIVGPAGMVVPPRDPQALADGLAHVAAMATEQRAQMGKQGRQRVLNRFSMDTAVASYQSLYENLLLECGQKQTVKLHEI